MTKTDPRLEKVASWIGDQTMCFCDNDLKLLAQILLDTGVLDEIVLPDDDPQVSIMVIAHNRAARKITGGEG